QSGPQAWPIDVFPSQVQLLRQFLDDSAGKDALPADHPYRGIHAMPRAATHTPELWMLGSGIHGAVYAAELGLPFSHAYFISADGSEDAAKQDPVPFKPSAACPKPRLSLGVAALVGENEADAMRL